MTFARGTLKHGQVRQLMHEWVAAKLLPDALVEHLSYLFPRPPPDLVQMHFLAFGWWIRRPPEHGDLLRLAALLNQLDLGDYREWIEYGIRKAPAFDNDVEAALRGRADPM